jgi:hypothetical protein
MAFLYRFNCWESEGGSHFPTLTGFCTRSGRLGYFDTAGDLTPAITSMAHTAFQCDTTYEPIIAVSHAGHGKGSLYTTLPELTAFIDATQSLVLKRMLEAVVKNIPKQVLHKRG